jgi:hypothetical protein
MKIFGTQQFGIFSRNLRTKIIDHTVWVCWKRNWSVNGKLNIATRASAAYPVNSTDSNQSSFRKMKKPILYAYPFVCRLRIHSVAVSASPSHVVSCVVLSPAPLVPSVFPSAPAPSTKPHPRQDPPPSLNGFGETLTFVRLSPSTER